MCISYIFSSGDEMHIIEDFKFNDTMQYYDGKITDGKESTMVTIKIREKGTSAKGMLHKAKMICQFDHKNIIKLYGVGELKRAKSAAAGE